MIESEAGRWNPTACKRAQQAQQAVWGGIARRGYTLMLGNACLATVRQRGRGRWHVAIEGFEFRVTSDMPVNRIVPGLAFTQVVGFPTSREGRAAVARILRAVQA